MLRLLDHLEIQYEPFPVGVSRPALTSALYEQLAGTWPDASMFRYVPELGHKWSLSERNHPDEYRRFLASSRAWRQFHDEVKSRAFTIEVVEALRALGVDLGLDVRALESMSQRSKRLLTNAGRWALGTGVTRLSTRFEFSMLPADGGHIKPHTDDPRKIITLVVSMDDGSWDDRWGGATDMLHPTDTTKYYNHLNRQLEFDEVEVTRSFPFQQNQCLLFVKTFNSLHSVAPMTGNGSNAMRRTLTINIERRG